MLSSRAIKSVGLASINWLTGLAVLLGPSLSAYSSPKEMPRSLASCETRGLSLCLTFVSLVAEGDAEQLGLLDELAVGVDVLELAGHLLERHACHLAVELSDHVAKLAG